MKTIQTTPWLVSWRPDPFDRPVLLCLPQAGAGCGQFASWQSLVGPSVTVVGVQLPGREGRWSEPPASTVDDVIAAVATDLVDVLRPAHPLVVFGHSFGGLLAYEITHEVARRSGRWPAALVVAGCRPPAFWAGPARGIQDDEAELAMLLSERGLDAASLDEETYDFVLGMLRQDAVLSQSYENDTPMPVSCRLEAWGGMHDRTVSMAEVEGWRAHTSAGFRSRRFAGGHNFCLEQSATAVDLLSQMLGGVPSDGARTGP